MADRTYLDLRGRTYWYIRDIPKKWRPWAPAPHTGKAHFRHNLKTSDLYTAQRRRPELNALFDRTLRLAEKAMKLGEVEPLASEAQGYQAFIAQDNSDLGENNRSIVEDLIEDRLPDIEREYGEGAAIKFYADATGNRSGIAVDRYLEQFNAEAGGKSHSKWKRSSAIHELADWRSSLYLHSFTKALCREFVDQKLAPGRKVATINSYLGALSKYWKWLEDRGFIEERRNYWSGFRRKEPIKKASDRGRPFTEEEIGLLFSGPRKMEGVLLDFSKVAALTGARQIEIGDLRVSDINISKMLIHLPGEKTLSADRTIPLHSALAPILASRCEHKQPGDYVFHELPIRKFDDLKPRSSIISKAFTRFRRRVGVGWASDKKDKSPVNFHSFRGWLASQMLEHGAPEGLVDNMCGWKRGTMRERYTWTAKLQEQARPYIEKVKLPI